MQLKDVHVHFDPRGIAGLHGLSLTLHPGEILAVMGPSGAGKSTLLKVLSGELAVERGEREGFRSVNLLNAQLPLPSETTLQNWLVRAIKREMSDEKRIQLARDMADFFELPMQLKRNVAELSQGQQQRARLCHGLIDAPEVLLLDEPFAHLDSILRAELLTLLKRYLNERELTAVWVTHDKVEALALADRIGVINHGRWEQLASPEEVFQKPRSMLTAQLMGHVNFLTATRSENGFTTSLGPWHNFERFAHKTHVVLPPRPLHFQLHPQGQFKGVVLERRFQGHGYRLLLEHGSEQWLIDHDLNAPQVGEIVSFNVDLSHSVVVDCL